MSLSVNVSGLGFRYGEAPVLRGFSQRFEAGCLTAVLGQNGCGKSTLLGNLLGYLRPEAGRVVYEAPGSGEAAALGRDRGRRQELSRLVGFVPQKTEGFSSFKVFDAVQMGRLPYLKSRWSGFGKEDRRLTEEILELLDLSAFGERALGSLSGGERQKVMLARCLVQDTPVVLLDEATASMDMRHTVEIMETLKERIAEKGLTVIAVMHDLNLAARYGDRLCFMKEGKMLCSGKPGEVMTEENLKAAYGFAIGVRTDERGIPFVLPGRGRPSEGGARGA